jgi:hypothetical protein
MNDGGHMAISPANSNIVFCAGNVYNAAYFIGVSHSSDGGTTWEHDTIGLGTRGWAVAFDASDPNRVYVGGDSAYSYPALLITTDLGLTWTMSRSGLSGVVNCLLTIPGQADLVYAGTNNGVFRSTDAGLTWSATGLTQQVKTLVAEPGSPQELYAGTYGAGVYSSTDGGLTWTQMNTGLTCNKVLSLAIRPDGALYAGTEGGSVFKTTVLTGIDDASASRPRVTFAVSGSPCKDHGCLEFMLPAPSVVRAGLYDMTGRLMLDFGARSLPAGAATWEFSTGGVAAGTYFVRLAGAGVTGIARLTVIE